MPTTTGRATDFITFTRTSNATVTDSNGFIKWAGHNLLTNSESFDAASWVKSSATVTANTDPAPNGTTTGDTIAASGANGTALQTWTAEAVPYTFGVWLRRKTGTGNIQIAADSGTYTTVTITSSWALYTVTQTPAAGSKSAGIRIVTSGDEVYAWGAHLYRSDLGGMVLNPARGDAYYPTTPRNLLGFTEDFSNAAWSKTAASVVSNSVIAPNGLQTADTIVEDTTNNVHRVFQGVTITLSPHTLSFYAKPAGRNWVYIYTGTGSQTAYVNIATGAVGTTSGAPTVTLTSAGNGWYRVSFGFTNAVSGAQNIQLMMASADGTNSYTGDGTSGIYLWGAQLSDSASLDAYSPVYGAAVTSAAYYAPRLDFDPVTLAARGLLVEEQRVNLLTYSAQFDDAAWVKTEATISANAAVAPDGLSTADKIIESTTASVQHFVRQGVTTTVQAYTFSAYVKAAGRTWCSLYTDGAAVGKYFDLTNGVVGNNSGGAPTSATITAVGSGWYRVAITFTSTAASVSNYIFTASANGTQAYTGDGTSGILVWGAQLEAGSFATSYIPTGAATATRTADVASVSTQAFPYSATEGTLVAKGTFIAPADAGVSVMANLDNGSSGESINIYRQSNLVYLNIFDNSGPAQAQWAVSGTTNLSTAAIAYKLNDIGAAVNGSSQTPDTSATLPTVDRMNIGRMWGGTFGANGWICQITYIPRRLSSSELQARTV